MMDVYMAGVLAVIFGVFYAFVKWCSHVAEDKEGAQS